MAHIAYNPLQLEYELFKSFFEAEVRVKSELASSSFTQAFDILLCDRRYFTANFSY